MKYKHYYFLMYFNFLLMSFSGVFSKFASNEIFLSARYLFYFGVSIVIMFIYAIIWQQVLKKIPLSIALLNRPVLLILSVVWAILIFNEKIGLKFFIGSLLIIAGLFIVNLDKINE